MAVYMGSSIYAPSEEGVMAEFGVNVQLASMGLSMYVLAYGLGPLLFSPLSEIPAIGRNPPYMVTYALFVILTVPAALVQNFPGLIVLRFLQGFLGSPCLATGGATLQDMFSIIKLPYVLSLWALAATCGPALGPIISGFSVAAEGWRWALWEMLWLSGPIFIVMFFFLPETSPSNILLRRARRLRAKTGNMRLKAQSEIDQENMKVGALIAENLYRPMEMMIKDPAVGFTALYTALIYGIYYSFFEAFPEVFIGYYGFNLGELGLTFLSITVGVIFAIGCYWTYVYYVVEPYIRKNGLGAPERRLIPALGAAFLCPIGLFIFGWTSRPSIHWIVPVIGITIFTIGIFIVIQCIFLFLPLTYPQYAASLFAGNDFMRSTLAAGAIHFSRPLYTNLGIGRGSSILGGLTCGCVLGVFALWHYGDKLRARSSFAAK
jgi:DHA1 family multidrug resistance protein-like MFS transporter